MVRSSVVNLCLATCFLGLLVPIGCVSAGRPPAVGSAPAGDGQPTAAAPIPPPPIPQERIFIRVDIPYNNVQFEAGKSTLNASARTEIEKTASRLKANPKATLTLIGHTSTGETEANQVLGLRRAEAVKSYLVEQGVDASRLATISMGNTRPAVPDNTPAHRKLNRRVEFSVHEPD